MKSGLVNALFFIAATSMWTGAKAQKVYRCGQNYSQTPCAGAEQVDTTDTRTPAQQKQTSQAAARDARAANALEKARLSQEKADLAANARPSTPAALAATPAATPASFASGRKKADKKEPEFFTAKVPEDKKAAKAAAKPAPKASSTKTSP
jgi:hypothetical protein